MAKEQKDQDKELSVEIGEEAVVEEVKKPTPKPEGAPAFKPLPLLRRRHRAEFQKTLYAGLPGSVLEGAESGRVELDLGQPGMLEFAVQYLANLEDAYALLAVDRDAYDEWVKNCSDEELQQLHTWYEEKYPMGEA